MSAPNPQTYKKRDGTPYIPRAKKLPLPSQEQTPQENIIRETAQKAYEILDHFLVNGTLYIEYDRIVYAIYHSKDVPKEGLEKFIQVIRSPDYANVIKPFLDFHKVPEMTSVAIVEDPEISKLTSQNASRDQDMYDAEDKDSSEPPKKKWTDNLIYSRSNVKKKRPEYTSKYTRLKKFNFIQDEAEEANSSDEDNIAEVTEEENERLKARIEELEKANQTQKKKRDPPTSSMSHSSKRPSPSERVETTDMKAFELTVRETKIIALAEKWSKSKPKYQRLVEKLCTKGDENCPNYVTTFYNDGMCGPCRSKANKKSQRKRNNELKALTKQHDAQLAKIQHRAAVAIAKKEMLKDLQEAAEVIGSESDADSSDNEENDS